MKTTRNIIWGIVLVAVGVLLIGNKLDLFHFNLFFKGWWTLFIIIPAIIGLFTNNDKKGDFIALTIGVLLLLACRNIISFDMIWELILPILIIVFGLSLIFKNSIDKEVNKSIDKLNKKLNKDEGYAAIFSGQNIKVDEEFKGTTINAVFGGLKLDLRNAIIKDDVVINATAVFGGIDIIAPENVKIKIKSSAIFGGAANKKEATAKDDAKTIYINATAVFGGVDVK